LTFLDHRLRTGDSLLGAWIEHLRRAPCRTRRPRREATTRPLFDSTGVESALRDVLPVRFSLELTPGDTLAQVRAKEQALSSLERRESGLSRWKQIADVWCSSWLSEDRQAPAAAFGALTDHVLSGRSSLPHHLATRYLQGAGDVSAARRLFHWELEFPELGTAILRSSRMRHEP